MYVYIYNMYIASLCWFANKIHVTLKVNENYREDRIFFLSLCDFIVSRYGLVRILGPENKWLLLIQWVPTMFKHERLLACSANIQHLCREAKALMLQQYQTALRWGGLLLAGGGTGGSKWKQLSINSSSETQE